MNYVFYESPYFFRMGKLTLGVGWFPISAEAPAIGDRVEKAE